MEKKEHTRQLMDKAGHLFVLARAFSISASHPATNPMQLLLFYSIFIDDHVIVLLERLLAVKYSFCLPPSLSLATPALVLSFYYHFYTAEIAFGMLQCWCVCTFVIT